jgi:hypothetical protein
MIATRIIPTVGITIPRIIPITGIMTTIMITMSTITGMTIMAIIYLIGTVLTITGINIMNTTTLVIPIITTTIIGSRLTIGMCFLPSVLTIRHIMTYKPTGAL